MQYSLCRARAFTGRKLLQTGMEENRDNVFAQEISSDRNSRRRATYAQMSPEKKQLFLSQLREKRAESKRQKLLHQSNSTAALTISASSLSPQQAFKPLNLPVTLTRRQCIVQCLSTFEVGSPSNASHVGRNLTSKRTANRGTTYIFYQRGSWDDKQGQISYSNVNFGSQSS